MSKSKIKTDAYTNLSSPISIAVISGRGGSGKTLIATAIAQALAIAGKNILLVDADLGTGGMTYYLGFNSFNFTREGLAEIIMSQVDFDELQFSFANDQTVASYQEFSRISLLPVGEHRTLEEASSTSSADFSAAIEHTVAIARIREFNYIIFDCRGGIDADSLEVCRAVKDILVVVETDAAAIQASQHLVSVLARNKLGNKLCGFILNKVIDNPSTLASAGASFFRAQCLGSIPFDIETTRTFIKGHLPDKRSLFARHVFKVVAKLYRDANEFADIQTLRDIDFENVNLREPTVVIGGFIVAFLSIIFSAGLIQAYITTSIPRQEFLPILIVACCFFVLAQWDRFRRLFGSLTKAYIDAVRRIAERFK